MKYEIIVIGSSLGGLKALRAVLSSLHGDLNIPVVIVQHRSADADDTLRLLLQRDCLLLVQEVEDKVQMLPGKVYLAPGGYHLMVEKDHFELSVDDVVNHAQPSIDVLFETAANSFGACTIGVVLTGTGKDGAQGLAKIEHYGGVVLVESPDDAFASEMPNAAITATQNAIQLRLDEIGPYLMDLSFKQKQR